MASAAGPRLAPVDDHTWHPRRGRDFEFGRARRCTNRCGDSCTGSEVSATCLLESFRVYVNDNRAALEAALGVSMDTAHLLSGNDFDASTAGLAFVSGLCNSQYSVGIEMASSSSLARDARADVLPVVPHSVVRVAAPPRMPRGSSAGASSRGPAADAAWIVRGGE